jgi:hypothetical protein|tara:strand:- start:578 stop:1099 length:522 start_codon:yes stop_codon:yes gene_type:complete
MSSSVCAASARIVAPRAAVHARAAASEKRATTAPVMPNRRAMLASVPALLLATQASPASAKAPPEYYDDTMEVIALTKSIISGADLSEANIAAFQAKRDVWYGNYQLHHEKGVGYGYANTFNAQAKVGFQIRVFAEKGEPFDPDRTVYNKDYLLEILDRGKTSLDEMKAAGQL